MFIFYCYNLYIVQQFIVNWYEKLACKIIAYLLLGWWDVANEAQVLLSRVAERLMIKWERT